METNPTHQTVAKSYGNILLELMAISGEYPADNIGAIIPGDSYARKVITTLTTDNLIKAVYKNGLRGYKLAPKGKRKLLTDSRNRFEDYLTGEVETNRVKATHTRRLRLHSMAQVNTLLSKAGVAVFTDEKPDIFANPSAIGTGVQIRAPCFYSSREYRCGDGENAKPNAIRGSRAAGALLTPTHVFAVYNTGNIQIRWGDKVEQRFRIETQNTICRRILPDQYSGVDVGGIMIGASMDNLYAYLEVKPKQQAGFYFLSNTYKPFYYITNDSYGETQLRLLCDTSKMVALKELLSANLLPPDLNYPIEHDALTEDGLPVLFCCLLDVPRLIRFKTGLSLQNRPGRVIAFDFQQETLRKFITERRLITEGVEHVPLSFTKFIARFF